MATRITALVLVVFSAIAVADAPFEDLSYPAALKKAKEGKKIVMIDFYTTWCGPCKMLDRITWADKDVQKWLGKHAVCMKVDAEASRSFAKRFKVRAYPTIVFIKSDGRVLDTIVGFQGPKAFVEAAEGALSGKDAKTRARESLKDGNQNDPMRRQAYARRLVELGNYKEALKEFLWCFDEGELQDPAFSGVRVSFLLGDIKNLADVYPPALEALKVRRDRAEQKVRDYIAGKTLKTPKNRHEGESGRFGVPVTAPQLEAASEVAALNDTLGANDRTIALYDELKKCSRKDCDTMRNWMFDRIDEDMLRAHRYEDYVADGDPIHNMKFSVEMLKRDKTGRDKLDPKIVQSMNEHARANLIKAGGRNYEACVGAGRDDLAEQVKSILISNMTTYLAYDVLVSSAVRAERYDLLQSLSDEARNKLNEGDATRISKTVKDYLATPEAKAALAKRHADSAHKAPKIQPADAD